MAGLPQQIETRTVAQELLEYQGAAGIVNMPGDVEDMQEVLWNRCGIEPRPKTEKELPELYPGFQYAPLPGRLQDIDVVAVMTEHPVPIEILEQGLCSAGWTLLRFASILSSSRTET